MDNKHKINKQNTQCISDKSAKEKENNTGKGMMTCQDGGIKFWLG